MSRHYIRRGKDGRVEGPLDAEDIRLMLASGKLGMDADAVEATGQSSFQLKSSQDWRKIGNIASLSTGVVVQKSVGQCPECGESVTKDWPNPWCPKCSARLPGFITEELSSVVATMAQAPVQASRVSATSPNPQSGSPVVNRYRDAYRVGATLVALGNAIKIVGAVLAGIIFLGSLSSGNGPFGGGAVVAGIFVAAIVGVLFWVCGVIVAAQGQILQATLDNAVASSHFLTDPERADAMGLPRSVANRSGA